MEKTKTIDCKEGVLSEESSVAVAAVVTGTTWRAVPEAMIEITAVGAVVGAFHGLTSGTPERQQAASVGVVPWAGQVVAEAISGATKGAFIGASIPGQVTHALTGPHCKEVDGPER